MKSRHSRALVAHCLALGKAHLRKVRPRASPEQIGPRSWFVLQTVMHGEDKVREALADIGFESYAPMMRMEVLHRRTRRPVTREFRLFNRYVFAQLPIDTRLWKTVEVIEEVDRVLGDGGGPCPVADEDIARFRAAEAARQFDVTKAVRFPIGTRVRVLSGPFGGFSGLVESLPGRGMVKAMLDVFARATPVDLPFDMVARD